MLKKIKDILLGTLTAYRKVDFIYGREYNDYKSAKVNLGQLQLEFNNKKDRVHKLSEVEFQVFSQFGDDGIIQYLINKIPIKNKTFIEFGVENYREANTRFLLINNYWSGLIIDGNNNNIDSIKKEQLYNFYDLQAECSFITQSNINDLISLAKFENEIGILSVDIDGNDYWVWSAINNIKPIIIICEYNSLFGFEHPYTIVYKDDFVRGVDYPFSFYGTSLRSAYDLAEMKGYSFIGCNSAGNNAYFIRKDYISYLPFPEVTPEQGYIFSSFTETWDKQGLSVRGADRIRNLKNLPVMNTASGVIEKVESEAIINSLMGVNKIRRF